jgi:rRNA maturation protein Nop10
MIHHDTKYNPLSASNTNAIPHASMQIASTRCFHCGQVTRFPVPSEFMDWKIVAEEYRAQLEKMVNRFDRIVKDIDVMQPDDNPVRQYLSNEWAALAEEIRKRFEQ